MAGAARTAIGGRLAVASSGDGVSSGVACAPLAVVGSDLVTSSAAYAAPTVTLVWQHRRHERRGVRRLQRHGAGDGGFVTGSAPCAAPRSYPATA